jgi:hypothetical protein
MAERAGESERVEEGDDRRGRDVSERGRERGHDASGMFGSAEPEEGREGGPS